MHTSLRFIAFENEIKKRIALEEIKEELGSMQSKINNTGEHKSKNYYKNEMINGLINDVNKQLEKVKDSINELRYKDNMSNLREE